MCRSLFEKDKLLFSLALAVGLMKGRGEVDDDEWRFLLTGGVGATPDKPNPAPEWMGEKIWGAFSYTTTTATATATTTCVVTALSLLDLYGVVGSFVQENSEDPSPSFHAH